MKHVESIDWKKVLEIEYFVFKSKNKRIKIERIYDAIINLFLYKPNLNKTIDTEILFLKSLKRDDYDLLFDEISSTCQCHSKEIVDIEFNKLKFLRIYPLKIFFRYFFLYKKAFRTNALDSIYLVLKMISYLEVYEKTKEYSYKKLVVFADMQPIDNMLVQIAKKKNILTVTMQHGLYIDYKGYVTENSVNYLHSVADVFLAWGDDTAKLIKKYHPKTVVKTVGKPLKKQECKDKEDYFTLVFDANYFMGHNYELLKISYKICLFLKLKVNLKLHPRNQLEWFDIDEKLTFVNKDVMASQFVLGHTTTMLYDCMITGLPVFRYKTDKPSNEMLGDLEFCDDQELIKILNNPDIKKMNFKEIGRYYFKYISTESKSMYSVFFKSLC